MNRSLFCPRLVNVHVLKRILRKRNQPFHCSARVFKKQEDIDDEPITFSTSKASGFRTSEELLYKRKDVPVYQMPIIMLSLSVFMIYFCILREENDMDDTFDLFKSVPWLEESELKREIRERRDKGLSVEELEKRLAEVQAAMKQ